MTSSRFTIVALLAPLAIEGCSYDVSEPLWDQPYTPPATPVIQQISPSSAPGGVNTIVITGQNLGGVPAVNGVFFNTTSAEVVSASSTSIVVRRPALVTDSCTVKVVSDSALVVARFPFGRVDMVMERFGDFRDNIALGAVAVDTAENLYVVPGITGNTIWRVSPAGDKSVLTLSFSGTSSRPPIDARLRASTLYLFGNNREIQRVNLATGQVTRWTQMPSGKPVSVGDFDSNGYLYTAGSAGTDLCILPPNPPVASPPVTFAGSYLTADVMAIRVFSGYVYVASRPLNSQDPVRVWRHAILDSGRVGPQELVLDLAAYPGFSSRLIHAMTFSTTGLMYLTTSDQNPLLVFTPGSGSMDFFYKGIMPPNGRHSVWGRGNQLYLISNDADNADVALRWNVARVNMGSPGAPYY